MANNGMKRLELSKGKAAYNNFFAAKKPAPKKPITKKKIAAAS